MLTAEELLEQMHQNQHDEAEEKLAELLARHSN